MSNFQVGLIPRGLILPLVPDEDHQHRFFYRPDVHSVNQMTSKQ